MDPRATDRVPATDSEHTAVREQLERILNSPPFLHSKHYTDLLRYVVESRLEGRADQIKERTLGIDVFGRAPDYDTNLDNIVRNTSTRVRKRLAQYYQDLGQADDIRIDLPPGSYVPVFWKSSEKKKIVAPTAASERRLLKYSILAVTGILLIVAGWFYFSSGNALDSFWRPMWKSSGSITICVGEIGRNWPHVMSESGPSKAPVTVSGPEVIEPFKLSFQDATALTRLGAFLRANGRTYSVRKDSSTTLADLSSGPIILIGAFNNQWTLRLTGSLRYTFQKDTTARLIWIADRENPSERNWKSDDTLPIAKIAEDFGIISRFLDETTGRYVVIAAGLRKYGTAAAGEFLTDPTHMKSLAREAQRGWEGQNLQVVFETKVINASPGSPRILATYSW